MTATRRMAIAALPMFLFACEEPETSCQEEYGGWEEKNVTADAAAFRLTSPQDVADARVTLSISNKVEAGSCVVTAWVSDTEPVEGAAPNLDDPAVSIPDHIDGLGSLAMAANLAPSNDGSMDTEWVEISLADLAPGEHRFVTLAMCSGANVLVSSEVGYEACYTESEYDDGAWTDLPPMLNRVW